MSVINIIILVILALVLLWGLNNVFLKTNIIYDKMCDASINANASTGETITVTGTNIIAAKDIPDTTSSNFTLSVWFYIDNWNNSISNYKNILFMATKNDPASNELDIVNGLSSKKVITSTSAATTDRKNIGIGLDKYDNNLFIDIECYDSSTVRMNYSYTRYKIPNISIQKWNNLTMSVDGRTLDVYLDGKLRNSFIMHGLYRNSYGTRILKNIYLGNVGPTSTTSTTSTNGFEGFITRIRFLGESCNPQDAYNFYKEGINASLANSLFNRYSLKVSFLEYNKEKGGFQI